MLHSPVTLIPMNVPPTFVSFSFGNANNADSSSPFRNILKFLLVAPFRGLARLLWLDGFLDGEEHRNHNTDGGAPMAHMASLSPGPWSFFASGYAVSLLAMVRRVDGNVSRLCLTLVYHTNRLYS
jgi:hypothetical protein